MDSVMESSPVALELHPLSSRDKGALVGAAAFTAITVAALSEAKWYPYAHKLSAVLAKGTVSGKPILPVAPSTGALPSWHGAWSFAESYGRAVWVALVAGILIGAAVEVLLPRRMLLSVTNRASHARSAASGAFLAVPCMMCTCCAAPITIGMRRSRVPTSAALAYWLGNPLLNPVVLVIIAVVLPWQLTLVRVVVGAAVVFAAAPLLARLSPGWKQAPAGGSLVQAGDAAEAPQPSFGRYLTALGRLSAVVIPEYVIAVLLLGAFRGWLAPLSHSAASWAVGAAVLAAIVGTLLVIPTAGEVPIVLALLAVGLPLPVSGALIIALPAVSFPSMVLVGRALSVRVTVGTACAVIAASLLAAASVAALA